MNRIWQLIAAALAGLVLQNTLTASSEDQAYSVQRNIVYGQGVISASTTPLVRDLLLDAYLPEQTDHPTPAVIMVFGGAFHRGRKEDVHYLEDGAQDSSMARYCQMLASKGTACFAIEYRLTPEDPAMPDGLPADHRLPKALLADPNVTARIALVRDRMGLQPLDEASREQYWNATFAAVEDTETAINHVRSNAAAYRIDPDRLALGGFSAGAITTMNVTYALNAPVCAAVTISGAIWGYNLLETVHEDAPPLLMFAGQQDLSGIRYGSGLIASILPTHGVEVEAAWIPGFGHFYPMGAVSLGPNYTRQSVEERILNFLDKHC